MPSSHEAPTTVTREGGASSSEWDERNPLYVFPDGDAVYKLITRADRKRQIEGCPGQCIDTGSWDGYFERGALLYSVRNAEGVAVCTLMMYEASKFIEGHANPGYIPYGTGYVKGLETPFVMPDGVAVYPVQMSPSGTGGGSDPQLNYPMSQKVAAWLKTLPPAPDPLCRFTVKGSEYNLEARAKKFLDQLHREKIAHVEIHVEPSHYPDAPDVIKYAIAGIA